jgi:putative DNA primase/helicase
LTFLAHAAAHGLVIHDLIADGRWHRCPTEDKPRKKNGAYVWDGERGCVINFATMTHGASFRPDGKVERVDRDAIRKIQAENARLERTRQAEARALAESMMKQAAFDQHPYLTAKGFPNEKGLVLNGELLIPMREFTDYKTVNSIQRIAPDGTKLFLPGGKAKGSVYIIGPMVPRERWLVEGYATGLSVVAALRLMYCEAQIVVCFSAGNLSHVGRLVAKLKPQSYVFADNDTSRAGAKAAEETGLPWCEPMFEGMDANDCHMQHGIRSLVGLIQAIRRPAIQDVGRSNVTCGGYRQSSVR